MTEPQQDAPRQLSRQETHDLSMIIKDRAKVLKAHAEEQAATLMADFERQIAENYKFDQDAVWKEATERALAVVKDAQEKIEERCAELGIPKALAPRIEVGWNGRGQAAMAERRGELRRVAKQQVEAMTRAAMTKIEKQSLDLRTQVVAMGLLSAGARLFLESLAPVEEAMRSIDFAQIDRKISDDQKARALAHQRRLYGGSGYE